MASPVVVAETASSSSSGSTTFTINTGSPLEGEGYIITLSRNSGSGSVTWSDSMNELFDVNDDDGFSSGAAAYKQAGASEPSSITVTSTTSDEFIARCYRISGHLDFSTQAPDVGVVVNEGNTTTHNPPSVNVTGGSNDILSLAALPLDTHNASITTYPTSYVNTGRGTSGVSGSQCSLGYGRRAMLAVASEDPSAFVLSTTRRGTPATILIQAAGGGGGGRIMSSMAGVGGLAHRGGIAGIGGGLAG